MLFYCLWHSHINGHKHRAHHDTEKVSDRRTDGWTLRKSQREKQSEDWVIAASKTDKNIIRPSKLLFWGLTNGWKYKLKFLRVDSPTLVQRGCVTVTCLQLWGWGAVWMRLIIQLSQTSYECITMTHYHTDRFRWSTSLAPGPFGKEERKIQL